MKRRFFSVSEETEAKVIDFFEISHSYLTEMQTALVVCLMKHMTQDDEYGKTRKYSEIMAEVYGQNTIRINSLHQNMRDTRTQLRRSTNGRYTIELVKKWSREGGYRIVKLTQE